MEGLPTRGALVGTNLETGGQNTRMRVGIMALTVALGLALALSYFDAPRASRAILFLPFFFALFGATQGLYRTCPDLAARGVREVCGTEEPIARATELRGSKQLARRVMILTVLGALAATLLFVLLP